MSVFVIKINKSSRQPYYVQIMQSIEEAIESGVLKDGDRLPTLDEVTTYYEISNISVIRAYTELEKKQRIERIKGRGTYVLARPKRTVELKKFFFARHYMSDHHTHILRYIHLIEKTKQGTTRVKLSAAINRYPLFIQEIELLVPIRSKVIQELYLPIREQDGIIPNFDFKRIEIDHEVSAKNGSSTEALLLEIEESDPLFHIDSKLRFEGKLIARVITIFPSKFIRFEVEV